MNDDILNIDFDALFPSNHNSPKHREKGNTHKYSTTPGIKGYDPDENSKIPLNRYCPTYDRMARENVEMKDSATITTLRHNYGSTGTAHTDEHSMQSRIEHRHLQNDQFDIDEPTNIYQANERLLGSSSDDDIGDGDGDGDVHDQHIYQISLTLDTFRQKQDERQRQLQSVHNEIQLYLKKKEVLDRQVKRNDMRIESYEHQLSALGLERSKARKTIGDEIRSITQGYERSMMVTPLGDDMKGDTTTSSQYVSIIAGFEQKIDEIHLDVYRITQDHNQLTQAVHRAWNSADTTPLINTLPKERQTISAIEPTRHTNMSWNEQMQSITRLRRSAQLLCELKTMADQQTTIDYQLFNIGQQIIEANRRLTEIKYRKLVYLCKLIECFEKADQRNNELLQEIKEISNPVVENDNDDYPPPLALATPDRD